VSDDVPASTRQKGRPRKPESERRSVRLRAYMTPDEAERLYQAARAERKTVSELIADRCLRTVS
jgi:hypothetical protein